MVVSTGQQLGALHAQITAKGLKVVNSDFAFQIEGFESMWMLTKQCPWPELSVGGEIEIAGPQGSGAFQPQQAKAFLQGPISMYETRSGEVDATLMALLTNKEARFNAKVFEGTPDGFLRAKLLRDCFIQLDAPDRDWENRSQVLTFSGTLFYHYFGESIEGSGY